MLVQYYADRLIVIGKTWGQVKGQYIYKLNSNESEYIYDHFEDEELIKGWVKRCAGDFETVEDFQLEVREKIKLFDNEDSWLVN